MSPETRKKVALVCFGEGRVRGGEEQHETDPGSSATESVSPPGAVEKPPKSKNSGNQLSGMGRKISTERTGLRTRVERGSQGCFI